MGFVIAMTDTTSTDLVQVIRELEKVTSVDISSYSDLERVNTARGQVILGHLKKMDVDSLPIQFSFDIYPDLVGYGQNIIVPARGFGVIVSCHYDVKQGSYGANDNGSGVAVALDLIRRLKEQPTQNIGVTYLFFDGEEKSSAPIKMGGLRGSSDYLKKLNVDDVLGFYNLDMIGSGDRLYAWCSQRYQRGLALQSLVDAASDLGVQLKISDDRAFGISDHVTFQDRLADNALTISAADAELASAYSDAFGKGKWDVGFLVDNTGIYQRWHTSNDTVEYITPSILRAASDVVFNAIHKIDRQVRDQLG